MLERMLTEPHVFLWEKFQNKETIMHMMTSLWDAEFSALIDHYPYHGHNKFILS